MPTVDQKLRLLRGLLTTERAYVGPFYAVVNVTSRCNLQCSACRFHGQTSGPEAEDIEVDFFADICHQLSEMKTRTLTITGQGEPTLHPHLPRLIEHARDAGLRVSLTTNGTLLSASKARMLVDSGLHRLKVSLWAGNPQTYSANYPGMAPRNFDKIVEGLKALSRYKQENNSARPYLALHHPCNSINFDQIDSIIDVARTTGCNQVTFSPVRIWNDPMQPLALSQEQEQTLVRSFRTKKMTWDAPQLAHNIDEMLIRYKIGRRVEEQLPCYVPWLYARIHLDGSVYGCHNFSEPMGNLRKQRLRDIWNDRPYRTLRKTVLTREGLRSLADRCNCDYCGQTMENLKVHRIFRFFSPLVVRHVEQDQRR